MTADRAEIGLQVIANTLVGVDLVEQRKAADNDYSVDGETTTINGRTFHGLFLALRKRDADAAVQSLIVPGGRVPAVAAMKLHDVEGVEPDPLRPPARAAAGLGVGDGRAARPDRADPDHAVRGGSAGRRERVG